MAKMLTEMANAEQFEEYTKLSNSLRQHSEQPEEQISSENSKANDDRTETDALEVIRCIQAKYGL